MILIPRAMICVRRISDVLHLTPEIQDGIASVDNNLSQTKEVVRFKTASFRFADADENTLENLNFTCRRGETTAIIGSTGSGKSTIAKLILRFHDVTSGSALLNGKDIRNMTQKELREHISYVPQKAWLFSGTIADNLRHGNDRATEQQMKHALSVAQSEFIYDLLMAFTPMYHRGHKLFRRTKTASFYCTGVGKKADLYILMIAFPLWTLRLTALRKALADEVKDSGGTDYRPADQHNYERGTDYCFRRRAGCRDWQSRFLNADLPCLSGYCKISNERRCEL